MKVQLSATIDAELSVRLSKKIKQSDMTKSAYIQRLIENDIGLEKSIISEKEEIPAFEMKNRLVIDVINTARQELITTPPAKFRLSEFETDGEYIYLFGKEERKSKGVSISTIFADERLAGIRKTELDNILDDLTLSGRIVRLSYKPELYITI